MKNICFTPSKFKPYNEECVALIEDFNHMFDVAGSTKAQCNDAMEGESNKKQEYLGHIASVCCDDQKDVCTKDYSDLCPKTTTGASTFESMKTVDPRNPESMSCQRIVSHYEMAFNVDFITAIKEPTTCYNELAKKMATNQEAGDDQDNAGQVLSLIYDHYNCCGSSGKGMNPCKRDFSAVCKDKTKYNGNHIAESFEGGFEMTCDEMLGSGRTGVRDPLAIDCANPVIQKDHDFFDMDVTTDVDIVTRQIAVWGCCGDSKPKCMPDFSGVCLDKTKYKGAG